MERGEDLEEAQALIASFIESCDSLVIFTGAGISTETGVPDFRSTDSPWLVHKPIPFQDYVRSAEARLEAWRRKFTMDDLYRHAEPGETHRFICAGVESGKVTHVVTQNIDNLHQRSGIPETQIIELHGNGSYARCMQCETRHEIAAIRAHIEGHGVPPACDACGGIVKSATISFGQPMPMDHVRNARDAMMRADGVIILGSSLVVRPAADLPLMARDAGARLMIINRDPTPLDRYADVIIRGRLPHVLPKKWPLTAMQMTATRV